MVWEFAIKMPLRARFLLLIAAGLLIAMGVAMRHIALKLALLCESVQPHAQGCETYTTMDVISLVGGILSMTLAFVILMTALVPSSKK